VAGNPAKVIRRIESGPNVEQHHPDIQEQNDQMLQEMVDDPPRVVDTASEMNGNILRIGGRGPPPRENGNILGIGGSGPPSRENRYDVVFD